jgi:hypothetical protein
LVQRAAAEQAAEEAAEEAAAKQAGRMFATKMKRSSGTYVERELVPMQALIYQLRDAPIHLSTSSHNKRTSRPGRRLTQFDVDGATSAVQEDMQARVQRPAEAEAGASGPIDAQRRREEGASGGERVQRTASSR